MPEGLVRERKPSLFEEPEKVLQILQEDVLTGTNNLADTKQVDAIPFGTPGHSAAISTIHIHQIRNEVKP